jgi:hypothetical protein
VNSKMAAPSAPGENDPESRTPLVEEVQPTKKPTSLATTVALCAGVLFASGAFLRSGGQAAGAAAPAAATSTELAAKGSGASKKSAGSCVAHDEVSIYKYTIASSKAVEDGTWADSFLGCQFRDVTDAHGCADLGKTSCLASTLAYNLHFVVNHVTPDSDAVATWDAKMVAAHGDLDAFNAWMDYRLVFYAPKLDDLVASLLSADTPFLLRQAPPDSDAGGDSWYSLVVTSPSGKVFEVTSAQLNLKQLSATAEGKRWLKKQGGAVKTWASDKSVCPHAQQQAATGSYSAAELDAFHAEFADGDTTKLLPIRNQIAVQDLSAAAQWWADYVPSITVHTLESAAASDSGSCSAASFHLPAYTAKDFKVETRLVQNSHARGADEVREFVAHVEAMHAANTAANRGWDAWYDRHLGLLFDKCPLDAYMAAFAQNGVSFNPHGRALTNDQGMATQHVWTEGVQGYGVEMQGFYDFSFRDCYTIFDWCTETTNGKEFCSADMGSSLAGSPAARV